MAAGDFVEVFNGEEYMHRFDAVVTCFFIDTAHNVIEYMETIWRVLKVRVQVAKGGQWYQRGRAK